MLNDTTINTIIAALERQERVLKDSTAPSSETGLISTQMALREMRNIRSGHTIVDTWTVDDVKSLVTDEDGEPVPGSVSDQQALEVLRRAKEDFDAERGINWDVLNDILNDVFAEGESHDQ